MGTLVAAKRIAQDTSCAQGGMMERALHVVPHLESFKAEVLNAERKRVVEAIHWFHNIEQFSTGDIIKKVMGA